MRAYPAMLGFSRESRTRGWIGGGDVTKEPRVHTPSTFWNAPVVYSEAEIEARGKRVRSAECLTL